jgi:hypothetical protein
MKQFFIFSILILGITSSLSATDPEESKLLYFESGQILFTKSIVKLRKGPGKSFDEILNIPKNQKVDIQSEAATNEETLHNIKSVWYSVRYGNKKDHYGWVFGGFLYQGESFMEKASDKEIAMYLNKTEWRDNVKGDWYHSLKFSENNVENSCVGECGQFGKGTFSIKDKIITIDFGASGNNADFAKENCHLFQLQKKIGIFCGKRNIYYLYN